VCLLNVHVIKVAIKFTLTMLSYDAFLQLLYGKNKALCEDIKPLIDSTIVCKFLGT